MTLKPKKVGGPWKWNNGHKLDDLMPDTHSSRHGARTLNGKQSILDIPKDEDLRKHMPLPYVCRKCGNAMLLYCLECSRCGTKTPLGEENWRA